MHRELESLTHELVAILDGQPLGDFAELLPVLRPVLLGIEADLLELLGVEIIAVTVEPHRITVDLAVLGGAIDERLGKIARKCVVGAIAELLDIEGSEQALVQPCRHQPVLADKSIRRGAGGKSDADLLAEIGERKPLKVHLDVRVLLHEQLDTLVYPGALLWIIESPEPEVDGLLGLGECTPGKRRGYRRPKASHADAANDVAPRWISNCRSLHRFLPQICGLIYRQTCLIFFSYIVPGSHTHRQTFVSSSSRSLLGSGYIPASAAIAESFPPAVGDGNSILEFDEAALRMQDRGLDRDHHPALKRTIRIGGRIGHRTLAGKMGGFVTHKAHSVGQKIKMRQLL